MKTRLLQKIVELCTTALEWEPPLGVDDLQLGLKTIRATALSALGGTEALDAVEAELQKGREDG